MTERSDQHVNTLDFLVKSTLERIAKLDDQIRKGVFKPIVKSADIITEPKDKPHQKETAN